MPARPAPNALAEMPGFVADMDAAGAWQPVPILLAMAEPNGPVEQAVLRPHDGGVGARAEAPRGQARRRLCVLHGAGLTTARHDPKARCRRWCARSWATIVPVVASYDLHANVSDAMVRAGERLHRLPHQPASRHARARRRERRRCCAACWPATKTHRARVRLPIVPPTVSMLTGKVRRRPYAELIDLGPAADDEPPYAGRVLQRLGHGRLRLWRHAVQRPDRRGHRHRMPARRRRLAREIAEAGWARREQFRAEADPADEAVRLAKAHRELRRRSLFADVADNPGGGGRGNTMLSLQAFHAGRRARAPGGRDPRSRCWPPRRIDWAWAPASPRASTATAGDEFCQAVQPHRRVVAALPDGSVTGRRGIFAGTALTLGASAALRLGGITVVVISIRMQCADPAFLEHSGSTSAPRAVVVVKSRGHFRGGFDEFFTPRAGRRGRCARPDLPDPHPLRLDSSCRARSCRSTQDCGVEPQAMTLDDLPTPCLVLDLGVLKRNLAHGARRWRATG